MALIGGTSTCHMAVSRAPKFIHGVWGPYFSAMVPGLWLTEGGQSATGALIDYVISSHARGAELAVEARREGTTPQALLNRRLEALAAAPPAGEAVAFPAELTRGLHVLPDHHGNRSPRADPTLRGMVSGLKLSDSLDQLALLYLATIQAIALGTRHILSAMNYGGQVPGHPSPRTADTDGYRIHTIFACGGDTKNPVFLREHADATGCRVVLPAEPEAVLLGAAILGAVASGGEATVLAAMGAMTRVGRVVDPARGSIARYFEAKYKVFQRMYADQLTYREIMEESRS